MKKISTKNIPTSRAMIFSIIIASGLLLFSFNVDVMGIPSGLIASDYLFGKIVGIVEDENGKPTWIISGTWKTNLHNQTQVTENNFTVFDAAIDMIKPDGTSNHTHALTNFALEDISNQNNATLFNGTVTISMPKGPVADVPISIQVMNNILAVIHIDSKKIDNHFGSGPIFAIPLEESE